MIRSVQSAGVLAKKGSTKPTSLSYGEALEEALCHGWIDGQAGRRDEGTYRQRFAPRRRRSPWSKRNVGIVERLIAEDRMHAAGLAEVERARADGRWDAAYTRARRIEQFVAMLARGETIYPQKRKLDD